MMGATITLHFSGGAISKEESGALAKLKTPNENKFIWVFYLAKAPNT